ncbi:transcription factor CP2-like [Diadema setosum]|uniref:transcription factor CP2-like n=1 Tax=Diadema setosum TaxID=31175 RepID=UPI003B3BCFE7
MSRGNMAWSNTLHVDDALAEDFASNLSGLGTELGTGAYNMSEVLALPMFKQEVIEGRGGDTDLPSSIEKALAGAFSSIHAAEEDQQSGSASSDLPTSLEKAFVGAFSSIRSAEEDEPSSFQVILNAATSPATKVNEETLTYLNQGQSYELKIKRQGAKDYEGKLFKSVVRVLFHDKRLQYTEQAQIHGWKTNRPGERILRIDLPLSYNIVKYNTASQNINAVEFFWDPSSTVGCFLQIHCISSEFTAKKHGGEKGVVFRIQVDTYYVDDDGTEKHLHSANCQVKVFKPKGADRKHKTDREKMEKKTDRHKYQPSYECTVLTECSHDAGQPSSLQITSSPLPYHNDNFSSIEQQNYPNIERSFSSIDQSFGATPDRSANLANHSAAFERSPASTSNHVLSPEVPQPATLMPLHPHFTAAQTQEWLKQNRFENYCKLFQNFAGSDLLRLAKEDLIRILGPADGIRLNNALQERHIRPRLTMYVCQEQEQVYHAVYLERPMVTELKAKLAALFQVDTEHISRVLKQGTGGIRVLVSDEMVQNISDESIFSLEALKDADSATYTIVMK